MEKKSKYLIILLVAFVICMAVFWFQFNNNVSTFILVNETEVDENASFSGMLMDAYGYGVANKTITYHKPSHGINAVENTKTDDNGEFTIHNAEYLLDEGVDNYYGNFTFSGDDKYLACEYEGNVTVIQK